MFIAGPHQLYAAIIRPALTNKGCMYVMYVCITRSSYYTRATGKAEAAVKEAKKMLKKADHLTGLLDHRNTPPHGMTYSPAQRFLCRRTKSNLPISESLLSQSVKPVTVVCDEHL